jgi:antitoxin VapB
MTPQELFRVRIALVQAVLANQNLDGVLLNRVDNFAAATGGKRSYIWTYADPGANALAVTRDGRAFFVGNNIERPRIHDEELGEMAAGYHDYLWTDSTPAQCVKKSFSGAWASDDGSLGANIHEPLSHARALLTPIEMDRYRALGKLASDAMTETLDGITAGSTEADIAGALAAAGHKRHCHVPVFLVAADERIAQYRHPLPTVAGLLGEGASRQVQRYVMVVGCFLREGLVVALTRFKQVDELPEGIAARFDRICAVDAETQEATQPGRSLGEVFAAIQAAYARHGFDANEWHNHHQGGATGYAGRTAKGTPGNSFPCLDEALGKQACALLGQDIPFGTAYAWNPSGPGVKSEDTFLLLPDGSKEIISATPKLPSVDLAAVLGRSTEVIKCGIAR